MGVVRAKRLRIPALYIKKKVGVGHMQKGG
jgi:hypothetical protein